MPPPSPPHRSRPASPLAARPAARLLLVLSLATAGPAAGCGGGGDAEGAARAADAGGESFGDPRREVRDLVAAVTPPEPDATALAKDDWYRRRREALERARRGGEAIGRATLAEFRAREESPSEVRTALLDVAAHAAPEATRPVLEELVLTYGADLGLRRKAVQLLGATSPEAALSILEPLVTDPDRRGTYPPAESMLAAWLEAAGRLGVPRDEVLAEVAADVRQEQAVRHFAVRRLGEAPSEAGRQALETVLVESLGDDFVRRLAAQALRDTLPREEFCALMRRVLDREANESMIPFLADMVETNCL